MRDAGAKSMNGLAEPERSGRFRVHKGLGHVESPTGVGDERSSHGWLFLDTSHCERSEPGDIRILVNEILVLRFCFTYWLAYCRSAREH